MCAMILAAVLSLGAGPLRLQFVSLLTLLTVLTQHTLLVPALVIRPQMATTTSWTDSSPSPSSGGLYKRNPVQVGGITIQQSLHQAAALGAMTLLLTAHRAVMNTGFTFSRTAVSTDVTILAAIIAIVTLWTGLVIASGFLIEQPCLTSVELCLARLSYAPWMLQIMSLFWIYALWDARRDLSKSRTWTLWCARGPFDWRLCLHPWFRWSMIGVMLAVILTTSYGAIREQIYTVGILNIVGIILFTVGAGGSNKYVAAPHRYAGDMIRIILGTSHSEGSVYILPSKHHGFDAVWSPKIESEHTAVDEHIMPLFQTLRSGQYPPNEPLSKLREVLPTFMRSVVVTPAQLTHLALWLYADPQCPGEMRRLRCQRAPKTHLIGRDLMYALCHAEYLLFMNRSQLPTALQAKVSMLRSESKSGAGLGAGANSNPTIGFPGGKDGYQAAVHWVYSLFSLPADPSALNPSGTPPLETRVLPTPPGSIDEYVAALWDFSVRHGESTVSALYIFTTIWFIEMGNVGGFHIFPLRTAGKAGDMVAFQVVWRQGWYDCMISQLVTMSPIILGAFIAGILQ